MARSSKFASGKYAYGICDRCGISDRLLSLREETVMGRRTGLKTCEACWDVDHPQNFLPKYVTVDAQALRDPRPDTGRYQMLTSNPPANWINGQRPTAAQVEEWAQEIEADRERQRANWRMEMEAQRLRQRSY